VIRAAMHEASRPRVQNLVARPFQIKIFFFFPVYDLWKTICRGKILGATRPTDRLFLAT